MNTNKKWVRIVAWVLIGVMVVTSMGLMVFM